MFWSRLKAAGAVWAGETGRREAEPVPLSPQQQGPSPGSTAGQLPLLLSVRYSPRGSKEVPLLQKFGLRRVTPSLGLASTEGEKLGRNEMGAPGRGCPGWPPPDGSQEEAPAVAPRQSGQ